MDKFWMVWSPQGNRVPSVRHPNISAAINEAARLATVQPNKDFFVMEARTLSKGIVSTSSVELTNPPYYPR